MMNNKELTQGINQQCNITFNKINVPITIENPGPHTKVFQAKSTKALDSHH